MADDEVTVLPLFPLGTVLFPAAPLPLHIFEERYRRMMADRKGQDPVFGVVLTRQGREVGEEPETYEIGTAASLLALSTYQDGRLEIAVVGGRRFRIISGDWSRGYLLGTIVWLDETRDGVSLERLYDLRRGAISAFSAFVRAIAKRIEADVPVEIFPDSPTETSYAIAARLPINTWERQALLEIPTTAARLEALTGVLIRERNLLTEMGAAGGVIDQPSRRFNPN
ncbi:MAG: LON peptidase substrate-binding domain-containing protein [Chloroflexota bacterium]|nr:LON peptidase substrate-binding domain-containing protein [Chloroflexota bacterium]